MYLIAIVDDDESVRVALGGLMKAVGYDSEVFASAEAFLRSGRARTTTCIIADVQMPGMSGLDLQDQLNRDGHRIPFIFMTAFPSEQVRARALAGGAVCFLSKPFAEADLLAGIDRGLALASP
jgi:FixJ family two-component response regulator